MSQNKTVFYPFSLNIPWKTQNGSVYPFISKEIWNKYIKNKKINIVCPGYLLEIIISANAKYILEANDIKIDRWIIPSYYDRVLNLFGISTKHEQDEDALNGFERINEVTKSYPAPIFFDKDKNVYFNMMFNYGIKTSPSNYEIGRNEEPFWKQILDNLCLSYSKNNLNRIDSYTSKNICDKYIEKLKIKSEDKYVLIDASNIVGITADKRIIDPFIMFPIQIKAIVDQLKEKKIYSIIMAEDASPYYGIGIDKVIPTWNKINSDIIVSLLYNSHGIITSDQNLYLLSALFGVKNIICLNDMVNGWSFDDIKKIYNTNDNENWVIFDKNKSINEIGKYIRENA